MAYATGTATNFADLYNKLRDFLTTDTALVTAGQEWTQIAGPTGTLTSADEIILQGPGTSGTDEILVGIKPVTSVASDYYNLEMFGLVSYNPALGGIQSQVGESLGRTLLAWNSPMTYWFVANGRRFIVVIKVATTYHMAYCGFILPYMIPTLWPYPLYIAGSSGNNTFRYSQVSESVRNPFAPGDFTACLCMPDGRFFEVWNSYASPGGTGDGSGSSWQDFARGVAPWLTDATSLRQMLDGGYALQQAEIVATNPHTAQYGALEGVFRVSGFSNASENIVTVGGVDHLVIQNVYRTDAGNFAAIRLE